MNHTRRNFLKVAGGSGMALLGTYCGLKFAHAEDYILDPGDYTHRLPRLAMSKDILGVYPLLQLIITESVGTRPRNYDLKYELELVPPIFGDDIRVIEPPPPVIYTRPIIVRAGESERTPTNLPLCRIEMDGSELDVSPWVSAITPLFSDEREAKRLCAESQNIRDRELRTRSVRVLIQPKTR